MKQKPIKGIEKYSNKWIAIDKDKSIVASGKSFTEVYKKVTKKDISFMAVPPLTPYSP